ncbi:MAG: hypothetical protein IKL90_06595 [Alphaproteobacteria bacterium]|nr:hypothetical protein [Alphaproteobacteria bacterium]
MFEDVANVKLSTYIKELGLVSCGALILCGSLVAYDLKISKDEKATSSENIQAKKVGTHAACAKCGARIFGVENQR